MTIAVTTSRVVPRNERIKPPNRGYGALVAERTQRRIERRASVIVVAVTVLALVVAGLWLLLPLTFS
jgi:hypothetical protein